MTNREWLESMAIVDMLTLLNRNSKMCIIVLIDATSSTMKKRA